MSDHDLAADMNVAAAGAIASATVAASAQRAAADDERRAQRQNPKRTISSPARALNGLPLKPGQSRFGGGGFF